MYKIHGEACSLLNAIVRPHAGEGWLSAVNNAKRPLRCHNAIVTGQATQQSIVFAKALALGSVTARCSYAAYRMQRVWYWCTPRAQQTPSSNLICSPTQSPVTYLHMMQPCTAALHLSAESSTKFAISKLAHDLDVLPCCRASSNIMTVTCYVA